MHRRPTVPTVLRAQVFQSSEGRCQRCGIEIALDTFHVAHLRAHSNGGPLIATNLAAWCVRCNLSQGSRDAADTRVSPREWQWEALGRVIERIQGTRVATVAAAPGAGKTVLAGLVFEALRELGIVERMVVLAPRRSLVKQWHRSLLDSRHLQLRPGEAHERKGEEGVIVTYQSLNARSVGVHELQAERTPTLFVLDEVHHVGQPGDHGTQPGWARYVTQLVGDVEGQINAAGVLNLSGTLWRSKPGERISTVRYQPDGDGRIVSVVDYAIDAPHLIRESHLRPVDLFRHGAEVELVDLAAAERVISGIADLSDTAAGRAVIRGLPADEAWRMSFVSSILARLESRHRDLGSGPAKGLIVAHSQRDARAFQETANRLMSDRGLKPIAELAVSDDPDAHRTLERFRTLRSPGLLCTVDMAGEGYDCPDIAVVGYATNKLTPLYVRQVVARAQRVTAYEREKIGRPLPAAVVIPDVPEVVEVMSSILEPVRHELEECEREPARESSGQLTLDQLLGPRLPLYSLESVAACAEGDARITGDSGGDVEMRLVRLVEPQARKVGLPESEAPRMIHAVTGALNVKLDVSPFDRPPEAETRLADALASGRDNRSGSRTMPLSVEQRSRHLRRELQKLAGSWIRRGNGPLNAFQAEVNRAAGIPVGGREDADLEQLERAVSYARARISNLGR